MKRWFIFYTQFNHEKKVHEELLKCGYESYYPKMNTLKQWSDRKKWINSPIFPCYNFVYCEEKEICRILSTTGIVKVVSFSGERAFLNERDIELIRKLEIHQNAVTVTSQRFKDGEKIKIESGCFMGLTGTVVDSDEGNKLVLLLELLGQSVVTTFESTEVKRH